MERHRSQRANRAPGRCRAGRFFTQELGGKDPPAAFSSRLKVECQPSPQSRWRFGTLLWSRHAGRPRTVSPSAIILALDEFAPGACYQVGKDLDVDVGAQEVHGPVREQSVGSAGVVAINFSMIRAVNGTRPGEVGPVWPR